jgi:peptidoglycan/xylan/chitin deacetylase (PgdA/CDA1 family)
MTLRAGLAILIVGWLMAVAPAWAEPVALTFDDLPSLTLSPSTAYMEVTTQRLLAGLRKAHVPATGFVNEIKLEGADRAARIALLKAWLDAGMDLGNHSYSHLSLTRTPVGAYIADVAKGETVTRALLGARGRQPRWFRHPYLETGPTPEIRKTFEDWLGQHGYRVAPVSMENADWMFALPYDDAVMRGDDAAAAHIREVYLDYTAKAVVWYRQAGLDVLGRRPAFVFLLHATRLNADCIAQIAHIFRQNDLQPVDLDRAMADPAYDIADTYAGPNGDQWLTRWARSLNRPMPWATYPPPPPEIAAMDQRLAPPP